MASQRRFATWAPREVPRPALRATVRVAALDDAAGAARLVRFSSQGDEDEWRERFEREVASDDRDLLVAVSVGEVVGYVRLGVVTSDAPAPDGLYLLGLVVHPDHRREGIAEALVEAAAQHAGGAELWSFHDVDNLASQALHERCGFVEHSRGDIGFPGLPAGSQDVLRRRVL